MVAEVGIREFRAGLAHYIDTEAPVAVTRHGRTVGYFIPVRRDRTAELEAFRKSASKVDAGLAEAGIDPDELLKEFEELRRQPREAGR